MMRLWNEKSYLNITTQFQVSFLKEFCIWAFVNEIILVFFCWPSMKKIPFWLTSYSLLPGAMWSLLCSALLPPAFFVNVIIKWQLHSTSQRLVWLSLQNVPGNMAEIWAGASQSVNGCVPFASPGCRGIFFFLHVLKTEQDQDPLGGRKMNIFSWTPAGWLKAIITV